ncbi:metallophosphoesterase [Microbulbifer elongatus]|uniref:metallophosphoesterase n=1 Tax=Microbulbifer elongatus TaxID=86173 RepID=UPI001CFDAFB0|nr:metallophosphoesterase [Microbulbifer elongatus]
MSEMLGISHHRSIFAPPEQRVWFCGDIHGQLQVLKHSLCVTGVDLDKDLLILTGDVIDRGPDSVGMLEFIAANENVHSVLGNHEWMYLKCLETPALGEEYCKPVYGGEWTQSLPDTDRQRLGRIIREHFTLAATVRRGEQRIGVIHARAPEDWAWVTQGLLSDKEWSTMLWDFSLHAASKAAQRPIQAVRNIQAVIHGHVGDQLHVARNQIWIDTLRCTGELTLLELTNAIALAAVSDGNNQKI